MFLVCALCKVKDGPVLVHILSTSDREKAISTADNVEQLGYEVMPNGEVYVVQMVKDHVYTAEDDTLKPFVFRRRKINGFWQEAEVNNPIIGSNYTGKKRNVA